MCVTRICRMAAKITVPFRLLNTSEEGRKIPQVPGSQMT